MHLKLSSAKWRPFCPGGDELRDMIMPGCFTRVNITRLCNFRLPGENGKCIRCHVLPYLRNTRLEIVLVDDITSRSKLNVHSQTCQRKIISLLLKPLSQKGRAHCVPKRSVSFRTMFESIVF